MSDTVLDRDHFLELLNKLSSRNDEEVLTAAREIGEQLSSAGLGWNDILLPPHADDEADDSAGWEEDHDAEWDGDADSDAADAADAADADDGDLGDEDPEDPPVAETRDDEARIDRLLAKYELSEQTREDLTDLKEDIAEGEFTESDRRYLQALEQRLSKR